MKIKILLLLLSLVGAQTLSAKEADWVLTKRQLCDLELLLVGGFEPLNGFMTQAEYTSVVEDMRLPDGSVWPMPIVLDVSKQQASALETGDILVLKQPDGTSLARLQISDIYAPDKKKEARGVYGTESSDHPGVAYLYNSTHEYYVGGTLEKIALPKYYDFADLRKSPAALKAYFAEKESQEAQSKYERVIGFQTRNPMHRAHQALTLAAASELNAHVLIHPVVGLTKPGDIDHFTRVKCYKKMMEHYPEDAATLSLLPLSMRMAGPREALWHALIRKNYGCTHFIVGRDHAGPGKDSKGNSFYGPYESQDLVIQYSDEIGITMVPFKMVVYLKDDDTYMPLDQVPEGKKTLSLSGTEVRRRLRSGEDIPEWFSYPEVVEQLRIAHPPAAKQGLTIFLTGLSASGKSTIASALANRLMELQERRVTVFDGDIIRQNLSKGLGFSAEDRSTNVRRVGFVAQEVSKHGGLAICALIAPYEEDRQFNREMIKHVGGYVEVHVSTPLEVCEERDPKGLYAKARSGEIANFTGISDPYEAPINPELRIDTSRVSIEGALDSIVEYLQASGFIR